MKDNEQKAIKSIKTMTFGDFENLFNRTKTVPGLTDAICDVFWQCVSHLEWNNQEVKNDTTK